MALGLSMILNLSNVINFAHGNFLALGGYFAFVLTPYTGFWGALLLSPLLAAVLGFVIERLMIRRVYKRDPVYSLLLTFGLAFILQDACRYVLGTERFAARRPGEHGPADQRGPLLHHLVSRLHGRGRDRRRRRPVSPSCATPGSGCAFARARSISRRWHRWA